MGAGRGRGGGARVSINRPGLQGCGLGSRRTWQIAPLGEGGDAPVETLELAAGPPGDSVLAAKFLENGCAHAKTICAV